MQSAFQNAVGMTYGAADAPNLSGVSDMSGMFRSAGSFNGDLGTWDVSGVTDMKGMFASATAFNGNLSSWNVSQVTGMDRMFDGAISFNSDISGWNVSEVTNMEYMFNYATSFNQPLGDWNVSSVTSMDGMFFSASSFNRPLGDWDVSGVTGMSYMFDEATSFNGDISDWNTGNVTDMYRMFSDASDFNGDLSNWDVSEVADTGSMFDGATSFNSDISGWDVSEVADMESMFNGATSFNQNLGNWYIVLDNTSIDLESGAAIGNITAQNGFLNGQNPAYGIGPGDDSGLFVVNAIGNTLELNPGEDHSAGTYTANITATGDFGTDNSRTISVTVTGDAPSTLDAGAFVTIWDATASPYTISIPLEVHPGETLSIDWGDGTGAVDVTSDGTQSRTYSASGEYQVNMTGGLSRINLGASGSTADKLASIDQWGGIAWTSMEDAFSGAANMRYNATDTPDLSGVGSMSSMFRGASSFDGDISSWNVSSVTDMTRMFFDASLFNQTLNAWDVSSVTGMNSTFSGASSFDGDISSWNVSSVTGMSFMFEGASSFDQTLNAWNVSSVTDMDSMFFDASLFNQTLNAWDVSSVTGTTYMFYGTTSFDGDISGWDVSSVTRMDAMFSGASSFDRPLGAWNVSSVTDMDYMFYNASSFDQTLNAWNVSSVTDMQFMFTEASSFDGDISEWDVSSVTDMFGMFWLASSFDGDISEWDVSSVTDMNAMFFGASSFDQPLGDWDVSQVADMDRMFNGATSFDQNLGKWYIVPNATSIERPGIPGAVGSISAQSPLLDGHNPAYGIGGGGDGDHFEISGDNLLNMTSADSGQGSYAVNVTASGVGVFSDGNNWEVLSVTIAGEPVAETAPVVSRISLTSDPGEDGAYAIGEAVLATVTFSAEVAVGGTPTLELDFGGVPKTAAYNATASGGADVVFSYAVAEHDEAKGGIAIEADKIGLNGGTIRSLGGADADLAHMAVGADPGHSVDSTRPELESALVDVPVDGMALVLTFHEPLDGDSTPPPAAFSVTVNGTANAVTSVAVNGTGVTLGLASAISPDDAVAVNYTAPDGGPIQDAAGNDAESFEGEVRVRGPLTAKFSLLPGNHDGVNLFKVRIQFTEVIAGSIAEFAGAVDTAGGAVEDQRRVDMDWAHLELDIRPGSKAAVTIALPATQTACGQAGAVCTEKDGRPLSGPLEGTVFGPLGVTVSPTSVSATEGGAAGNYTVVLDAPPSGTATVTVTETGGDVTASPATLEFNATTWDAPQTVTVTAIDDSLAEDEETATLTHSVSGYNATAESVEVTVHDDDVDRSDQFVTTWRATGADKAITVPVGGATGSYTVNWGDGSVTTHTADAVHEYDAAGSYTVRIFGDFARIHLADESSGDAGQLRWIRQWGSIQWQSMDGAFEGASKMRYNATDTPDLSGVTDMTSMFRDTDQFDGDLGTWDVSQVADMSYMFRDAASFNGSLSSWDVSGVTTMTNMFNGATSFNQPLGDWDVSQVADMSHMFWDAASFNQPLGGWNVSGVTRMGSMFYSASDFNQPLGGWNVSQVTAMSGMFHGASSFDGDLSSWDVSQVAGMSSMFRNAASFNSDILRMGRLAGCQHGPDVQRRLLL